ncbi:hypothetical protein [Methylobacterium currus]|uniref:hypothetical protein n=1 Tax=Methylobacterium currus TaxID=2051553 RepID=UPI001AEC93EE|nr:hypothetical protein [Methylobacterium currus]
MIAYFGATCFGALVGWYVYYINRYRRSDVQLGDLTTVVGVIGGGVVTVLFKDPALFGAYGLGLALGFFGYFLVLIALVRRSQNFSSDWFLDGRRTRPAEPIYIPGDAPPPASGFAVPTGLPPGLPSATASALSVQSFQAVDAKAERIIRACEDEWPATKGDCSAFVRDVAAALGMALDGNANAIVDRIKGAEWQALVDGREAKIAADQGLFVVGGLKGGDQQEPSAHGHVVVVVAGPLARGLYPTAYWGRLGGVGERAKTVNWAWRAADRDKVVYAARSVP